MFLSEFIMITLKTNDKSTIFQSRLGSVVPYRPMESCVELPWAAEPLSKVAPERKSLAFNRPLKYLSKDNLHHCGGAGRRPNFEPILIFLIEYTAVDHYTGLVRSTSFREGSKTKQHQCRDSCSQHRSRRSISFRFLEDIPIGIKNR